MRRLSAPLRRALLGLLALISGVAAIAQSSSDTGQAVQASSSYVIQPMDFLVFRIIGEPETEVHTRVSSEGTVLLPYVKSVKVAGISVGEAQRLVFELYDGDYYIDPQVDLVIMANAIEGVEVMGYVMRQGRVPLPAERELYLLEALSLAGGAQQLGDLQRVKLRRVGPDGETEEMFIDTREISARDHPLRDGDIVEVPRRRL
ncbi:MAG: polysaccharide biosynthesis/export family protein [Opitutales bacterium]